MSETTLTASETATLLEPVLEAGRACEQYATSHLITNENADLLDDGRVANNDLGQYLERLVRPLSAAESPLVYNVRATTIYVKIYRFRHTWKSVVQKLPVDEGMNDHYENLATAVTAVRVSLFFHS